jgi:NADH dehydrogenase (ubiquinone) Fe-S protein 6
MIQPPETITTESRRVKCDGATSIRGGAALGHPRVWLEIAECGYCDRRFVLKGGPADSGASPGDTHAA